MFLSTTETIPGIDNSKVRYVGFVYGGSVQARNGFKDIGAGFKNMTGGALKAYEELIESTSQTAMQKMMNMAQQMGANGIVGIKVNTTAIAGGAAEFYLTGTAVVVEQ